jgi:hypothetical protein
MPVTPNAIDLTTLAAVKSVHNIPDNITTDDQKMQDLITEVSQYWLDRTIRGSLNSVVQYSERYDGKGRDTLMLRYYPIRSVVSLKINGRLIPESTGYGVAGWMISDTGDQLILVGGYEFCRGRLNVEVVYTAGFDAVPFDVKGAVTKQVAVYFKRQKTIDQASLALPEGGGQTNWRSWEIPPEVERVIGLYKPGVPI